MGCNGHKKDNVAIPAIHKIVIKKLDSTYFNKINGKKGTIQFAENDSVIELEDYKGVFLEHRRKNKEKLEKRFSYDKKTNLMISSGPYFYEIPIGFHQKYNEKGEVVEEKNQDKNFPFSVYDLIQKIKKTHHIDLNDTTRVIAVSRNFSESSNRHIYAIVYKNGEGEKKAMSIDGQTGEILYDGPLNYIE